MNPELLGVIDVLSGNVFEPETTVKEQHKVNDSLLTRIESLEGRVLDLEDKVAMARLRIRDLEDREV